MALPALSISKAFNLTGTPTIKVTDTTDWGVLDLSGITENFTLTSPVGVFHNNTDWNNPDLARVDTDYYLNVIPIQSGVPYQGEYTIEQRVKISTYIKGIGFGTNTVIINALDGDVTDWLTNGVEIIVQSGLNAGTYTVQSSTFTGNTIVTITGTFPVPGDENVNIEVTNYITQSYTATLCYEYPSVQIQQVADCDCGTLTVEDLTNYTITNCGGSVAPTIIERTMTTVAPNGQNGQPVMPTSVTSLSTNIIVPAWTKIWTTTVSTNLTYTLQDGTLIELSVTGSKSIDVVCDDAICCARQCLVNLQGQYFKYKGVNPTLANKNYQQLFELNTAYMLYSIAVSCGDAKLKSDQLLKIKAIASTNCDCGCDGDETAYPVQLSSCCTAIAINGNAVVVESLGNGITVSSSTVGGTVTYTLGLDSEIVLGLIAQYIEDNPQSFAGLSDVNLVSLQNGQYATYNSTTGKWENHTLTMADLATFTSLTAGDSLVWNGSVWVNQNLQNQNKTLTLFDLPGVTEGLYATGNYNSFDYSLPLATGNNPLSANGDVLEIETVFVKNPVHTSTEVGVVDLFAAVGLKINGVSVGSAVMPDGTLKGYLSVRTRIQRVANNRIYIYSDTWAYYANKSGGSIAIPTVAGGGMVIPKIMTVSNMGTTPLNIVPTLLTTSTLPLTVEVLSHKIISIKK